MANALCGELVCEYCPELVWAEGRRYFGLDVLGRARLTLIDNTDHNQEAAPAINAIRA